MKYLRRVDIQRLPVEVWREVFQYCIEPEILYTRQIEALPEILYNDMNIKLSHVCRYFRAIALSMPSLWSTWNLGHAKLDTFLERSSQLPITIVDKGFPGWQGRLRNGRILKLVRDRIISFGNSIPFRNIGEFRRFSNMQHLMINDVGPGGFEENIKQVLKDFKDLKSLVWHNGRCSRMDVKFSSPIRYNLTSLRLGHSYEEPFLLSLLRSCPLLETLHVCTRGNGETETEAMVSLPRLKTLQVTLERFDNWLSKIKGASTLDLCTLDFENFSDIKFEEEWCFWPVSLDLRRHQPSGIISWLANEPGALKTLTLAHQWNSNIKIYLDELKWPDGRLSCPGLEELRIPFDPNESKGDLCEIYFSRIEAGLKPLRIFWRGAPLYPTVPKGRTQQGVDTTNSLTNDDQVKAT
jgi:hypothetical protein